MAKPAKIKLDGKSYYAWHYEEQTQIKHKVLGSYYRIFASKLGKDSNTLFFDCHGGCGAYIKDNCEVSYGSSILVSQVADSVFQTRKTNNYCIVCENDDNVCENLKKVVSDIGISRITIKNGDYNYWICDRRLKVNYTNCPTLFFIDPFGYYDTPMEGMKDLMHSFGNEIIINFMFDFLNRGIGVSAIDERQLNSFFGDEQWKEAKALSGAEREAYLVDLYKRNLKRITGAKYVFSYRLCYPDRDQTYYYLIHATNHIDGITAMKDCFAAINNGRVEYLGKRNNEISLFDIDYFKQNETAELLKNRFAGKTLTFRQLWESVVEETALLEKDLRSSIKLMEQSGDIRISRIESKRTGLKGLDIIYFRTKNGNN